MNDILNTNWNQYASLPKTTALQRGINHLNTNGKNYTTPIKPKSPMSITGALSLAQGAVDMTQGIMGDLSISDYNPIDYSGYNSLESLNLNSGNTAQLNLQANDVAGGALSGALSGAQAGMAFGPVGAVIGGAVGGLGRLVTGMFGNDKKKREERRRYGEALEGLNAQAQYLTTSEVNRNMWNDFKDGGYMGINPTRINNFTPRSIIGGLNKFESGGMMTNGGIFSNTVNIVGEGGTHSENKYGGVPISLDENGNPNLVEQGEVVWNNYVFSNTLTLKDDLMKGANLPNTYKGKTYAKIAEDIQKESEERPYNPISQRGLTDGLGKLIIAQELERMREQEKKLDKMEKENMYALGGPLQTNRLSGINPNNLLFNNEIHPGFRTMNPYVAASVESKAEQKTMSSDDLKSQVEEKYKDDPKIKELYLAYINNGITNPAMLEMLVRHDILESGGKPHDNNWGNITAGSTYKGNVKERGDKDSSGKRITQKFRMYDTTDDYVKDKLRLLKNSYDFDQNDSAETFAKKLTGGNEKKRAWATDKEYTNKLNRIWGGEMTVRSASYQANEEDKAEKDSTEQMSNSSKPVDVLRNQSIARSTSSAPPTTPDKPGIISSKGSDSSDDSDQNDDFNQDGKTMDSLLGLAPIVGNMGAYATSLFEKPPIVQYDRVSATPVTERMNYTPVNDMYAANIIQNQYAGLRRDVLETTGGNRGIAQTALLSNDRNMSDALYNSYYAGQQTNFERENRVRAFNAGVDQYNSSSALQADMTNVRVDMEEKTANEQNIAALDERRQLNRNAVLENLQGLATQKRWEKLAPIISLGYDQYGRKVTKK